MELDTRAGATARSATGSRAAPGGAASPRRAVTLLRDFGVDELGLTRIELLIHEDNVAVAATAERAGFVGHRRAAAPRRAARRPARRATCVYAWSAA